MTRETRFHRPGRRFALLVLGGVALIVLLMAAVGWYYSSLLHSGGLKPDYSPEELNLEVVSVEGGRIVLTAREGEDGDSLEDDETWGLEGESGYGRVGAILETDDDTVTREFELVSGAVEAGDFARLDSFTFDGDPSARDLAFRDVTFPSPLGDFPAWELDGESDTWVIFVHGWRARRDESLRILPTIASLGLPSLVITYRNDEGAPPSDDGLIRFGATEWQDLEAAVDYALAGGARSIILYGCSTGGGIAVSFLGRSDRADAVTGVILDAPLLDFGAVVDYQAERRSVPGFIAALGKQFATWRFDVDWGEMDHFDHLDRLQVPVLLFHGDDDDVVPIETSERLARERPDIVNYIVTPGAGHVRSWNSDPEAYEQAVSSFLSELVGAPAR